MRDEITMSGARPGYHLPAPKDNPAPPQPSKVALTPTERRVFEAWGIRPTKTTGAMTSKKKTCRSCSKSLDREDFHRRAEARTA